MPSSVSAKKTLRQNETRRTKNHSIKAAVRTQIRKLRASIEAGDVEKSESEFRLVTKKIDQAASKNILHANTAARTKSRLSKAIKALKD